MPPTNLLPEVAIVNLMDEPDLQSSKHEYKPAHITNLITGVTWWSNHLHVTSQVRSGHIKNSAVNQLLNSLLYSTGLLTGGELTLSSCNISLILLFVLNLGLYLASQKRIVLLFEMFSFLARLYSAGDLCLTQEWFFVYITLELNDNQLKRFAPFFHL